MVIPNARQNCPRCGALLARDFNYGNMENELLNTVYEDEMTDMRHRRGDMSMYRTDGNAYGNEYREDYGDEYGDEYGEYDTPEPVRRQPVKLVLSLLASVAVFGGLAAALHAIPTEYVNEELPAAYQQCIYHMADKDYSSAKTALKPLLKYEDSNLEYLAMQNTICEMLDDTEEQIGTLKRIIELDEDDFPAFESLLELYLEDGNLDGIKELAELAPNNTILAMLKEYLVEAPVLELAPGVYDPGQELPITSPEDFNIYYTTDGTDPKETGKLYYGPFTLAEGHTKVRAVCRNESGVYGEEASAEYDVQPAYSDSGGYGDTQTGVGYSDGYGDTQTGVGYSDGYGDTQTGVGYSDGYGDTQTGVGYSNGY